MKSRLAFQIVLGKKKMNLLQRSTVKRFKSNTPPRTHPVSDVEEALFVGEVEQEQEAHGVPEERSRQAPKPEGIEVQKDLRIKGDQSTRTCQKEAGAPFLPCGVPELQVDLLTPT